MWINHGDPFAGPLVSPNVAVRVLFVFLLLSTKRYKAGKLQCWRCLQRLEDSTRNGWSNLCQSEFLMRESVATVLLSQFVKGAKLSHDSELQEMDGEDAQTYDFAHIYPHTKPYAYIYIYIYIHIHMQIQINMQTGIQIDKYLDIEIHVHLSCHTITCTERMHVQIHLYTCTPRSTATRPAHWITLTYWTSCAHMCAYTYLYICVTYNT